MAHTIDTTTLRQSPRPWYAIAAFVALAGAAGAATLDSAPAYLNPLDQAECTAVNVGTAPIGNVTVDLIDLTGGNGVVATNTCTALPYNAACYVFTPGSYYLRCRVTVTGGSPKHVRAQLDIRDSNNDERAVIDAR